MPIHLAWSKWKMPYTFGSCDTLPLFCFQLSLVRVKSNSNSNVKSRAD